MTAADLTCSDAGDGICVARLVGELDMSNADGVRVTLERRIGNDVDALLLDLSDTGYLDSTGIQLLYQLRERLAGRGQHMRIVVRPDSPVEAALRYAGVLDALAAVSTLEEARQSLAAS